MSTVYFSGSISGGRADVEHYRSIVSGLERRGIRVIAGEVTNSAVGGHGEELDSGAIFERDLAWIEEAARAGGALVAEVTTPSLGVGYEVAAARYLHGIPVVALFRPSCGRRCSAMISGDPEIAFFEWEPETLEGVLDRVAERLAAEPKRRSAPRQAPFSGLQ